MKKQYLITIKWIIERTDGNYGFQVGYSKFQPTAKNKVEAINDAIDFAENIPSSEFERNGIDLRESKFIQDCRVMYKTRIEKIMSIEVL